MHVIAFLRLSAEQDVRLACDGASQLTAPWCAIALGAICGQEHWLLNPVSPMFQTVEEPIEMKNLSRPPASG